MTLLRLITIGDAHFNSGGSANLDIIANYLKSRNNSFDLITILGDYENLSGVESALGIVGKPVIFVKGNHDSLVGCNSIGSMFGDNVEIVNGYQLITVGICGTNPGIPILTKTYDHNLPSIVFVHLPSACLTSWSDYNKTGCNYVNTLELTKLLAVYSGHIHKYTNQTIGNVIYVTEDNLGGNGPAGDYIGYTCFGRISGSGNVTYTRLNYKTGTTIPDCREIVACSNPTCILNVY